jgi:hypothetical protein
VSTDRRLARLFERRQADEEQAAQHEAAYAARFKEGPPPNAQLVFSPDKGVGVAVRGARLVCPLPKGYDGRGLELALIDGDRLIVTHPTRPPLLIDPQLGTTRPL